MDNIALAEKKVKPSTDPLENFFESLPARPYCTDELGTLFIRPIKQAIKRRYIQQNSPWDLKWLVYDVDRATAHFDWYELNAPVPNITAMNLENGHSHLFYGLEVPVVKASENPKVHQGPLRYAASIDVALTRLLEADPGYAGLICKNPLNSYWDVKIWEQYPYDLEWLADYVDLSPFEDRRKHLPPIGLGRNATLFDVTRHWAYRQIRKGGFLDENFFRYEIEQYALARNAEFPVPLPYTEIKATSKSVSKWTWRHMSPEGFLRWGDNRRVKSIRIRQTKGQQIADKIRAYKKANPHYGYRKIAEELNYSRGTVLKALQK